MFFTNVTGYKDFDPYKGFGCLCSLPQCDVPPPPPLPPLSPLVVPVTLSVKLSIQR